MKRAIVLAPWVVLALLPASAAANPPAFTCTTVQFEVALSTDLVVAPSCTGGTGAAISLSNPLPGSPNATFAVDSAGDLVFQASVGATYTPMYTVSDGATSEQHQLTVVAPGAISCARSNAAVTPLGIQTLLPCTTAAAPVTVVVVEAPTHGTAALSGMTLAYLPPLGFSGNDHLVYTATDANGHVTSSDIAYLATTNPPDGYICAVDHGGITQADFDKLINQSKISYQTQGQHFPSASSNAYAALRDNAVNYQVEQELYRQYAAKLGVQVTDADVTARLNQLIQGFFGGNLSALDSELKKQGITLADVRANLTEQLLTERLYERVTKGVTATRAQALHYYRHNQRQYRTPPMRGVRHILVTSHARAWRLYWNVHRNPTANFGRAARKYSQDPSSAGQGGALTIARGQTVPEFDRTAFSLTSGAVSTPVHTQFGWHIIWATTPIRRGHTQPFHAVAATIRQTLGQERKTRTMMTWRDKMRKAAVVTCRAPYRWSESSGSFQPGMLTARSALELSGASYSE